LEKLLKSHKKAKSKAKQSVDTQVESLQGARDLKLQQLTQIECQVVDTRSKTSAALFRQDVARQESQALEGSLSVTETTTQAVNQEASKAKSTLLSTNVLLSQESVEISLLDKTSRRLAGISDQVIQQTQAVASEISSSLLSLKQAEAVYRDSVDQLQTEDQKYSIKSFQNSVFARNLDDESQSLSEKQTEHSEEERNRHKAVSVANLEVVQVSQLEEHKLLAKVSETDSASLLTESLHVTMQHELQSFEVREIDATEAVSQAHQSLEIAEHERSEALVTVDDKRAALRSLDALYQSQSSKLTSFEAALKDLQTQTAELDSYANSTLNFVDVSAELNSRLSEVERVKEQVSLQHQRAIEEELNIRKAKQSR